MDLGACLPLKAVRNNELCNHRTVHHSNNRTPTERRNDTHQCKVNHLYQPSTGHKSICQVSDGLNHSDQLKTSKPWVTLMPGLELMILKHFEIHLRSFSCQRSQPSISLWVVSRGPPCTNWRLLWTWLERSNGKIMLMLLWLTITHPQHCCTLKLFLSFQALTRLI